MTCLEGKSQLLNSDLYEKEPYLLGKIDDSRARLVKVHWIHCCTKNQRSAPRIMNTSQKHPKARLWCPHWPNLEHYKINITPVTHLILYSNYTSIKNIINKKIYFKKKRLAQFVWLLNEDDWQRLSRIKGLDWSNLAAAAGRVLNQKWKKKRATLWPKEPTSSLSSLTALGLQTSREAYTACQSHTKKRKHMPRESKTHPEPLTRANQIPRLRDWDRNMWF